MYKISGISNAEDLVDISITRGTAPERERWSDEELEKNINKLITLATL